ncbi:XRE family transcriptional regulator [Streptomyces sp. ms191]|nr:XRE family transcriptional regulator [Streptomyces sp. ms191]
MSGLIRRIQDQRPQLTQSEIARRIGISPAAVNSWVRRKRGTGRGPNRETLTKLAGVLGVPESEVFTAAGRKTPGRVAPDREQRIVDAFRELTVEQQEFVEIQIRALVDYNQKTGPA